MPVRRTTCRAFANTFRAERPGFDGRARRARSSADLPRSRSFRPPLLGGERADRTDALIERCGLWAVVGQRFVPGISDAFASYAFGTFGVPLWQMAVGAFIGSAPRAFAYTALGAAIGDRSPLLASCAIAVWCVTAIIGAFAARHGYRQWRAHARGDGADGGVEDPDREVGAR